MSIFKSFDESIFNQFRGSSKESMDDIIDDNEELEKIEYEVSQSRREIDLRVNYSGGFANHVFFGSAYASINFALKRILDDYPLDGELKDRNEWRRVNSGYDNYFFEQYPKRQGYLALNSGSQENWVEFRDYEHKLLVGTGSACFDVVFKSHENIVSPTFNTYVLFSYKQYDDSEGFWAYLNKIGSTKYLNFLVASGSAYQVLSTSFDSYLSESHAVSFVYDYPNNLQKIYIDGYLNASASLSGTFTGSLGEITNTDAHFIVGAISGAFFPVVSEFFTGAIDDVRVWIGPLRSDELIKKNFYKTTYANFSGGLKLYWKFNETEEIGTTIFDYSGYENHGKLTGSTSFSFSQNIVSGTLGSWFKDKGEPIYSQTNTLVDTFLSTNRSGALTYDRQNRNFIYNLVPSFFIDEGEEHEEMQRFLLLIGRTYDQLKLYIKHLSHIWNTDQQDYDNTPDELINFVAKNFGLDLGNVYPDSSLLQYFFGEDVLVTGSLDTSVQVIRNQLRRNLLSNLIYIIKTKSTRESLETAIRSLGLDEDVVNINEYSVLSGGISDVRNYKNVERRVANFSTSSILYFYDSTTFLSGVDEKSYEVRFQFNTASTHTTSSILSFFSASAPMFFVEVERENPTSSYGTAKLYYTGSTDSLIVSSSLLQFFNNNWVHLGLGLESDSVNNIATASFYLTSFDRDDLLFSAAYTQGFSYTLDDFPTTGTLGTRSGSSTILFDGHMQEFRAWESVLSQSIFFKHAQDFESLATHVFENDFNKLLLHYKLNDFTASTNGTIPIHDYSADGISGAIMTNMSTSAVDNFPGKYLDKLEPSYSYDIAINKNKIRIRDRDNFVPSDTVKDIPYLSVDMSPAVSLNKEIVKWFGDIERFNELIGIPYLRYQEEIGTLVPLRSQFFSERINNKTNFRNYLELLKWFDNNFSYFLAQLIPLDLLNSLSNFIIESHLLEFNQVPRRFPFRKTQNYEISGAINPLSQINFTLDTDGTLPIADPGRYGAAVSASAQLSYTDNFTSSYFSGQVKGLNFQNTQIRNILTDYLQENSGNFSPNYYGNGFFTQTITGSNPLFNLYNVKENSSKEIFLQVSGVDKVLVDGVYNLYNGHVPNFLNTELFFKYRTNNYFNFFNTGTINLVQDKKWFNFLKYGSDVSYYDPSTSNYNFGIGYGGFWGQIYSINYKDFQNTNVVGNNSHRFSKKAQIPSVGDIVKVRQETEDTKTLILWPTINSFEPIIVANTGTNLETGSYAKGDDLVLVNSFGEIIEIEEDFVHLNVTIAGKRRFVNNIGGDNAIKFKFYFQFFDESVPGDDDFESTFTSEILTGGYSSNIEDIDLRRRKRQVQEFEIVQVARSLTSTHNFIAQFERELPKARYMRTFFRIEFPVAAASGSISGYDIQVKGTLHKETTEVQRKFTES